MIQIKTAKHELFGFGGTELDLIIYGTIHRLGGMDRIYHVNEIVAEGLVVHQKTMLPSVVLGIGCSERDDISQKHLHLIWAMRLSSGYQHVGESDVHTSGPGLHDPLLPLSYVSAG